ncbi:conserved Plasmodium protein, unknown function [Plasmodium knowlesi strain H]|uniref:VPS9 domain-containing protein n=3 Tax=Plasmodium knowlesi TaxID=5850 RepID=A0A5K1VNU8_PLAKH|nr:VPS9 domain-containing protein, putative [Plasmodium knowlesi strain H]OTN65132.1 Uncharacterized protein PKNOH_S120155900 [Plasmodium knowlesi]CAA9988415.1 VPS9 domain-containing protein, putative [Plasmodium knowlesi strain H]SBO19898.1 conserved Plasmodium protein, unknown function [Plasmodium knowlesi strain H]SBO20392.1 conserved Plasmodium protein, unknown function [Plasmodium knowlesi strain H]VVS77889.1 VPS9 domain-containing protein, putative [Plasmodium knowlesi strain H]|eukprot:XP_002259396.1 hypothetical protein, conserved in Plasmodium species [Plasmodium knowlesi strain H]
MEPVRVHPVLSILGSKYKSFHENLSNRTHIILLPEAKTLVNISIDIDFLKKHICYKSHLKNVYINLSGQSIEIDGKYVCTGYGFEESRICEILKIETNANYRFLKIIFINIPLEGGYQDSESMSYINDEDGKADGEVDGQKDHQFRNPSWGKPNAMQWKHDVTLFFKQNENCREFLYTQLWQFSHSYIIVKGFENCIGKKIINMVDDTLKLQIQVNESTLKSDIRMPLMKYTYSYLYNIIWKQLTKNYQQIENKVQEKMNYVRKDISGFLKKLNLRNISMFHVETTAFHIKQMEKCNNPIDKIYILDNISKIICEIISCTNQKLKKQNLKTYDINSDSLISILVAAISFGQIKNIISHSIHLHMYIDNLKASEKIDKLSFVFTIFHSSIIYLCDMKEA